MYITYIIIGVTVVISFAAWKQPRLMSNFILNPYAAHHKNEYYRFITSGFIHKDHMHLLFNMFSLYFFGIAVETVFGYIFGDKGWLYFILLYILAIVVSDIPTFAKHKNNPRYNSLGASGGVSAIIFGFIIFQPLSDICLYFALCLPGFILGTLYIIFSWYQGRKANDNINHDAHLYGALFGLLFCIVMYPSSIPRFIEQIKNWEVLN
ncbi:rhomboid family intramembrane serine protease [Fulvivirgaceae bacterium PWU20]|uniref:Rhomboid family intramembrane serine protease n=2 Tax=Chryseosolibacter indicus TaxID=2782351 RepID=A0ABS5VPJ3_9BACT|nr:rhomboid family intramembrane serine protease [Chryseosolibacter indicus]MBT1703365.1 rhomboid family intramembrane serine protease [Chryseosolibacter indicus]